MHEKKLLPIGLSDYKEIIDKNCYYIDKTLFINDILKYSVATMLLPRPRRFGKTLNMSMLKYFFEKTEQSNAYLFEDKKIWQLPECVALQGKFPVIFVTFKDIKDDNWQAAKEMLIEVIVGEYEKHRYILESDQISNKQKKMYNQIVDYQANDAQYKFSLKYLSELLYRVHKVKPIVLIDEYDAPIHSGFLRNYYPEVLQFVRGIMTAVFKDNVYLERGVITGILHIVKEGIFSGLNNLEVFTIVDDLITDKFGFTQKEVEQLLQDYDLFDINQDFKDWYNGYLIGSTKIYNPWSVLSCIKRKGELLPYWVNTSDNELIYKAVVQSKPEFKDKCADLIQGKIVENIKIDSQITLPSIIEQPNAIWDLLLFSGYVTPHANRIVSGARYIDIVLPNKELHDLFVTLVKQLFNKNLQSISIDTLYDVLPSRRLREKNYEV